MQVVFTITPREACQRAGWHISKQTSEHIVLRCCPACGGGKSREQDKFVINCNASSPRYGSYGCQRRNNCGTSGNFWQLLELAGLDPREYIDKERTVFDTEKAAAPRAQAAQQQSGRARKRREWMTNATAGITEMIRKEDIRQEARSYTLPTPETSPLKGLSPQGREYLHKRGVTDETIGAYRICSDRNGNIAIPALEPGDDGQLVRMLTKFRAPRDVAHGEKDERGRDVLKSWKDAPLADGTKIGKPALIGKHLLDRERSRIHIFEGEIKALIGYQAIGYNCLSVPYGAGSHDWLEEEWELVKGFDEVVICADNDQAGRRMVEELSRRLPSRDAVRVAKLPRAYNDLTDLADAEGLDAVRRVLDHAQPLPPSGIVQMSRMPDVPYDVDERDVVVSGLSTLDEELGGLLPGKLSLIGGYSGQGKTTTSQNFMGSAFMRGMRALYCSFEDTYEELRQNVEVMLAGPDYYCETEEASSGKRRFWARPDVLVPMRTWYDSLFYGLAECQPDTEQLFDLLEIAVQRHGVGLIVVDNLMALKVDRSNQYSKISSQEEVIEMLAQFAKAYSVHIIIVLHNNLKSEYANLNLKPSLESFRGGTEIVAWAHNAIQTWRIPQSYKDEMYKRLDKIISAGGTGADDAAAARDALEKADTCFIICKGRGGVRYLDVLAVFDYKTRRYAPVQMPEMLRREMGWEVLLPDDAYRGSIPATERAVRRAKLAPIPPPVARPTGRPAATAPAKPAHKPAPAPKPAPATAPPPAPEPPASTGIPPTRVGGAPLREPSGRVPTDEEAVETILFTMTSLPLTAEIDRAAAEAPPPTSAEPGDELDSLSHEEFWERAAAEAEPLRRPDPPQDDCPF